MDDDDTQAFAIFPASLSLTEGGASSSFTVRLQFQPSAAVSVAVLSSDAGAASVSPVALTFTPADYATPKTVTVSPVDDLDVHDESVAVTMSSLDVPAAGSVAVAVADDDVQAIILSSNNVSLTEGGAPQALTAYLQYDPAGTQVVTLSSSDPGAATASPAVLTFDSNDYGTPQPFSIAAVEDDDVHGESLTVTLASAGVAAQTVSVVVADDDTQVILAAPNPASVLEGATAQVLVTLGYRPSAPVTVTAGGAESHRGRPVAGGAGLHRLQLLRAPGGRRHRRRGRRFSRTRAPASPSRPAPSPRPKVPQTSPSTSTSPTTTIRSSWPTASRRRSRPRSRKAAPGSHSRSTSASARTSPTVAPTPSPSPRPSPA